MRIFKRFSLNNLKELEKAERLKTKLENDNIKFKQTDYFDGVTFEYIK